MKSTLGNAILKRPLRIDHYIILLSLSILNLRHVIFPYRMYSNLRIENKAHVRWAKTPIPCNILLKIPTKFTYITNIPSERKRKILDHHNHLCRVIIHRLNLLHTKMATVLLSLCQFRIWCLDRLEWVQYFIWVETMRSLWENEEERQIRERANIVNFIYTERGYGEFFIKKEFRFSSSSFI